MKKGIIFITLLALLLGSCNFFDRTFNKKKRQRELLEQQRIQDSIRNAEIDSIKQAEEFQRQLEQARIDSLRMVEEAALAKKSNKYHVIAGSFKVPQNAESFAKQMDCEGYQTAVLDGKAGFSYVSVGAFDSFASAANLVKQIRDEGKYKAWIRKPN